VGPEPPEGFGDRGDRFTGAFRANRFSHTSLAKLAALGSVKVRLTKENTLETLNREWIEVAPLTFQEKFGDQTLHFREGEGGEITHMFLGGTPILAFERIPFRDNPTLHYLLAFFAGVMMLGTALALPLGWMARKWYGVKAEDLNRLPSKARLSLWFAAKLFLIFLLGMVIVLSNPAIIAEEITVGLRIVLLIPLVAAVFTVGSIWFAIRAFQLNQGRRISRFLYSAAVLSFCTFLWQLQVWNLLGWRF
jgi:hypothetical protein